MRFIKYSIAWFASVLIVGGTGQASFAFTLIPNQPGATENWKPTSRYFIDGFESRTEVDTRLWAEPLPLGGSETFKSVLFLWSVLSEKGSFGWDFQPAQQELSGNFTVRNYVACGYSDLCGVELPFNPDYELRDDGVGASFLLQYNPAPEDPQLGQRRVHWIQIARASFTSRAPGYISNVWFIDNFLKRDTPYADTATENPMTEGLFLDIPYNPNLEEHRENSYFEAETYLVEEITSTESQKREVIIYNGIKWGFINRIPRRLKLVIADVKVRFTVEEASYLLNPSD
ncbi:hypothetical protein LC593_31255 [Nostoc sp. CHAB 5844]|nr:hypothetical protein [Nostoc sp. CHAB 5844]